MERPWYMYINSILQAGYHQAQRTQYSTSSNINLISMARYLASVVIRVTMEQLTKGIFPPKLMAPTVSRDTRTIESRQLTVVRGTNRALDDVAILPAPFSRL